MHRLRVCANRECPAEAILPDTEDGLEKWLEAQHHLFGPVAQTITKPEIRRPTMPMNTKGEKGQVREIFQGADPGEGD